MYAELAVRDNMRAGLKRAKRSLGKFAKTSAKIMAVAGAAGTVILAKKAVSAASDMEETVSKSNTIFGESAKEMEAWGETAAKTFGQSKEEAMGAAATLGNLFVSAMGLAKDEAAEMSREMVELASDLASFNNTEPDEAVLALSAAIRGESEPIRRYGVLLNEATLKAKALEMGLHSGKGTLDPTTKALAAYQVILEQTSDAQGDFAKTSDGLANSQRTLNALLSDAVAEMGEGLLPVVQELVDALKEIPFDKVGRLGKDISSSTVDTAKGAGNFFKGFFEGANKINPLSYIPGDLIEDWANKGFEQANNAPFMRGFTPGQAAIVMKRDAESLNDPEAFKGISDKMQKADPILGDKGKIKTLNAIAVSHREEMAIMKAREEGDFKKIKALQEQFRIEGRIRDLVAKEIDLKDAQLLAESEAQQRALTTAAELSRQEELDARRKSLDKMGGMEIKTAEVNAMQARGLSMGRSEIPQLTKNTRDLVKMIHEQLSEILTREESEGTF